MGSLCSKHSTLSGGHTVLGSSEATQGQHSEAHDSRQAAAEAAERRRQTEQARGTHTSNPRRGELARKVEESKAAPKIPELRQEERLVWD